MLLVGISSSHVCLDSDVENNVFAVSFVDETDSHSSDVSLDCCESSCHHNCNHFFSISANLYSEFFYFTERTLVDSYNDFIPLNYISLPSKPPKA